jgi:hypothetical protein
LVGKPDGKRPLEGIVSVDGNKKFKKLREIEYDGVYGVWVTYSSVQLRSFVDKVMKLSVVLRAGKVLTA